MMKTSNILKIIGITVFIILLSIGSYASYRAIDNVFNRYSPEELNKQTLLIASGVVSQQIEISNKVFREEMKGISNAIKDSFKERGQRITDLGNTVAVLKQTVDKMKASDHVYAKGSLSDNEFVKIYNKDADGEAFPIAWAMYQPNQTKEKRWKTGTYPLEFRSTIVLGESEKRSDSVVKMWVENNQMKETKGKKFPIDIKEISWSRAEQKNKFMFNPRFSLGIASTMSEIYPSLDLSFFSYGISKSDMTWRFLEIGIGGTDTPYLLATLLGYNIAKNLPLVQNVFLEPFVDTDFINTGYGLRISVPF